MTRDWALNPSRGQGNTTDVLGYIFASVELVQHGDNSTHRCSDFPVDYCVLGIVVDPEVSNYRLQFLIVFKDANLLPRVGQCLELV